MDNVSYVATAWFISGDETDVISKVTDLIVQINHDENNKKRFIKDIKIIANSEGKLCGAYVLEGRQLSEKPNLRQ